MNHLPIAKKTYTEKAASKFQISPLDGAQYESIPANNIQRSNKNERYTRITLLVYAQEKTPKHKSTQIQSKNTKIQHQINQAAKT